MIRRPPRSTLDRSSAASDVYKRQEVYTPLDSRGAVGLQFLGGRPGGVELLIPFGIGALAVKTQLRSLGADYFEFYREAIKPILNLRPVMRRLSQGLLF